MPLPIGVLPGGVLPFSVGAAGVTVLVPGLALNKIFLLTFVIRNPAGVAVTIEDTTGAVLIPTSRGSSGGLGNLEIPAGRGVQIRLGSAAAPPVTGNLHLVQG